MMRIKSLLGAILFVALLNSCSTPTSRGYAAGEEYCACSKEEGILNIGKCKKEVLAKHKKELLEDEEFRSAFWNAVADCDE